jgi:hypothetical protein
MISRSIKILPPIACLLEWLIDWLIA